MDVICYLIVITDDIIMIVKMTIIKKRLGLPEIASTSSRTHLHHMVERADLNIFNFLN